MTEQAKQELAACLELRAYWRSEAIKARTERDAALASIAELEKSYRIIERLYKIERYKIERQERIEAEARIAEAAKHPAAANCMFSWRSASTKGARHD